MASEKAKETKGKLEVMNRQKKSIRNRKNDKDMISVLPNSVLLNILEFLKTEDAVKTCVLSKHWKNHWRSLSTFRFNSNISRVANFKKFVSGFLSNRNNSISLIKLSIVLNRFTEVELLNDLLKYAVSHNVKHLKIFIHLDPPYELSFLFPSFILSCSSLTSLQLSPTLLGVIWNLPRSLQLPALTRLYLENVRFTASDNDCAEPFSSCIMLKSLVLKNCHLHKLVKVLCINNSNLDHVYLFISHLDPYEIVFSTPNLKSLTIKNFYCDHQLSSTCNLSLLEVDIDACFHPCSPFFVSLLQLLTNVKKMTLSFRTLKMINILLHCRLRFQPPSFVKLESLKIRTDPISKISDEVVSRIVKYLLQRSPITQIDVISC